MVGVCRWRLARSRDVRVNPPDAVEPQVGVSVSRDVGDADVVVADAAEHGTYGPFAYLTTPNAGLYRRVMKAMVAAKERFTVHARPDDVYAAVIADGGGPVTAEEVSKALDSLAGPGWGNLLAFPDTGRVTAIADFYNRRMLYQLSRAGEAAERALARFDESLGSRGALQAVALEDIVVLLTALTEHANAHAAAPDGEPDHAAIHQAMIAVRGRFTDLAENAVDFMGSIQRTIDLHDADVEAFLAYKERLIDYLQRFLDDLIVRSDQIARLLRGLSAADSEFLCQVAGRREARDVAPGAEADAWEATTTLWRNQWRGLVDWFVDTPTRESEAKLLRSRARSAIPALLAVVGALHERGGGRADRSRDFVTLAEWFAALETDDARHRLWRTAFGLTSTRHLAVTPETVEAWEAYEGPPSPPWQEAPTVQISAQLRKTGQYERRGRANRVADRSAAKEVLAARAREQAAQTAAARDRLLAQGPRRLADFDVLDAGAFRLFLALLGDALAGVRPGATRSEIHTSDGELKVVLDGLDTAAEATLHTLDGRLTGPDVLIDIQLAAPALPAPDPAPDQELAA